MALIIIVAVVVGLVLLYFFSDSDYNAILSNRHDRRGSSHIRNEVVEEFHRNLARAEEVQKKKSKKTSETKDPFEL